MEEKEICFEPLKQEDLGQIVEIEKESFSLPWTRGMFEQEINLSTSSFFVARIPPRQEIIGYAGFWQVLDELHLVDIAVKPVYRGRGVGQKLLRFVLYQGKQYGLKKATLEVRISNIAALQLYRKAGFLPVAIRRKYYADNQEDALIMWLENLPGLEKKG